MGSHTDDGWIPAPTLPSVGNSAGPSTGPAAAWRDSPLPSPAVGAADLPVIRTAPHLTSIATTSAKFPAKFGVAEEEPAGPRAGLTKGLSKQTPTIPVPLVASRCGASLKQEKPPRLRGL